MLNTLVFIAMITSRQYRAPANHLLIMLNTIDLAAGLLLIPLYAVYMSQLQHGTIDCVLGKVLMVAGYSITIISTITIGFMTSQLYHAILNPFKYHRRVSNKSTYIPLVSSIWIVIITSVFVFVFILPAFWNLFKLVTGTIFLIIYCSLCIAHKKIYSSTRMILKSNDQSKQSLVTNRTLPVSRLLRWATRYWTLVSTASVWKQSGKEFLGYFCVGAVKKQTGNSRWLNDKLAFPLIQLIWVL